MKYELLAAKTFDRSAKKLPPRVLSHITAAIFELQNNPRKGEPLRKEYKGVWSLHTKYRNTEYRVIYTINDTRKTVDFIYIGSRENIYKRMRRLKIKVA